MLTCDIMTCLHFKPETHSIKWICHVACSSRQSQSRKLFLTSIYQILMSQQEFLVQKRKSTKINENEQYRKFKKSFFFLYVCLFIHAFIWCLQLKRVKSQYPRSIFSELFPYFCNCICNRNEMVQYNNNIFG